MKNISIKSFLTLTLAFAGVGLTHSELMSSTPGDGEALQTAPAEVTLTFSEGLATRFSTLKVYPLGAEVADTEENQARINGLAGQLVGDVLEARGDEDARADTGLQTDESIAETVSLSLKPNLSAGVYVVMWRILSADSHTSQGFTTFRVAP